MENAMFNQGWGSEVKASGRPLSGWESAADRVAEQGKRIEAQVSRLESLIAPILGQPSPPSNGVDSLKPGHACDLLQVFNSRADDLSRVADKLEALIERIRL
jgi:hypothetical protein